MATNHSSGSGSSTSVIDVPAPAQAAPQHLSKMEPALPAEEIRYSATFAGPDAGGIMLGAMGAQARLEPESATAVSQSPKWNSSRLNVAKVLATFASFLLIGANDAAYGAILPYLETYYHINYTIVSLVFLSPLAGYIAAAFLNNKIHLSFGQRGVAILGAGCHIASFIVVSLHPPYPALVIGYIFAGFATGLLDAAWNAWIGNMVNANELMGFLHGFYGLGATLSPLIATTLVTKANQPWYVFYYIMTGGAVIELALLTSTFWNETGKKFREENPRRTADGVKGGRLREALSNRVPWMLAFFLLGYVGAEVALGGWLVTFMIRVRKGDPFDSGMTVVGFWLGLTLGRVILGFVTGRIGEKLAVSIYFVICMGLELLFWLVPQFVVSAIAVAFLGFFLGPLFPAAVVVVTKLLPRHLHISAIGFAVALGSSGAAILPFAIGAVAQARGVQVLQPIILAILAAIFVLWLSLPRVKSPSHTS